VIIHGQKKKEKESVTEYSSDAYFWCNFAPVCQGKKITDAHTTKDIPCCHKLY
jgi:hypothetical protein